MAVSVIRLRVFVAALLVAAVATQSLTSVLEAKERALSNLATSARSLYRSRCGTLGTCSSDTEQCEVPACGNDFPISQGFLCNQDFGLNTGRCGSSCSGMVRSLNKSVVRFPPGVGMDDGETQAFTCGMKALDAQFNAQRQSGTIRAWQYIGHDSGSIRIYPGAAQERTENSCSSYDARLRPWYIAGSSGPKDIVIIVDKSASMQNDLVPGFPNSGTRMTATVSAVSALLGTLSPNDNVGVVTFSNTAEVLGGFTTLQRATTSTIESLQRSVSNIIANGGTRFNSGFDLAYNLFRSSTENVNCNRVILFLTDGEAQETESEVLGNLTQWTATLTSGNAPHIFTYTMSSAANHVVPKAIACAHKGVWTNIADGVDPLTRMRSYFQFLASGIGSSVVRWTSVYEDAFGLGQMVTAALPVYESIGGLNRLVGVVGADITMDELGAFGDSVTTIVAQLYQRGRSCTVFALSDCEMQYLRQSSSSGAVCPSTTSSIAQCDSSNEVVRPSPCTSVTGGLNSVLCTSIDGNSRLAATGDTLTDAEATCCSCGGSGRGRFGSAASAGSSSSEGGNTAVIIGVVVGIVVVIAIVGIIVFVVTRKSAPDGGAANNTQQVNNAPGETELERRRRLRAEEERRKEEARAAPPLYGNNNNSSNAAPNQPGQLQGSNTQQFAPYGGGQNGYPQQQQQQRPQQQVYV